MPRMSRKPNDVVLIDPIRHRLGFRTLVELLERVIVVAPPPVCYECRGYEPVRPFQGRILCERCIVITQLRRP